MLLSEPGKVIRCADHLQVLLALPAETIDLILAAPGKQEFFQKGRPSDYLFRRTAVELLRVLKPGGVLVFSTCTIAREENEENMMWFMNNYPFKLESLDPYLPEELHSETTALGYLQLLPGVHKTDGFFIAKFRRK